MCASCDGRCSQAAGTTAELGNLTRFLTYHDHHGYRAEARRLYAELDDAARDWQGADLEAARRLPQPARLRQAPAPHRRAAGLIRGGRPAGRIGPDGDNHGSHGFPRIMQRTDRLATGRRRSRPVRTGRPLFIRGNPYDSWFLLLSGPIADLLRVFRGP